MEQLVHSLALVREPLPPTVLEWVLQTAHPLFQPWRALLARTDLTDSQAWTLLWRDGALERSSQKIPGSYTANTPSQRLAETVAIYLARPDVTPGAIGRIRERLNPQVMTRLDLLREVVNLDGADAVCKELVAEPPLGSSRAPRLGKREMELLARYRAQKQAETAQREQATDELESAIRAEESLIARVKRASSTRHGDPGRVLRACIFGNGTVAPRPDEVDVESAQWLGTLAGEVKVYHPDADGLGEALSAVRPLLEAHLRAGNPSDLRFGVRRVLGFGPAGQVPLGYSVAAEEGTYVLRRLDGDVSQYQALGELIAAAPDQPLSSLCDRARVG